MNKIYTVILAGTLTAISLATAVPAYQAMADVENEFEFMRTSGWGTFSGLILVGQLERPNGQPVASRINFRDDGSFCTALHSGRKLMFYAHGYDPLQITGTNIVQMGVVDTGLNQFALSSKEDLRTLEVTIIADKPALLKEKINTSVVIKNNDSLWDDDGHRCGSPLTVWVESQQIEHGERVHYSNLSRIPYRLRIESEGFVSQDLLLDSRADGMITMDPITLVSAPVFEITYRCRIRHNNGEWNTQPEFKSQKIICTGNAEFKFTDQRDGLGNSLGLRMKPKKDTVEISFFYWGKDNFCQIKNVDVNNPPDFNDINTELINGKAYLPLQERTLYLFKKYDVNDTDIELLFHAKRI